VPDLLESAGGHSRTPTCELTLTTPRRSVEGRRSRNFWGSRRCPGIARAWSSTWMGR